MMWVISFIFIRRNPVEVSGDPRHEIEYKFPIERIIFISAFLSFVRCLDVGVMFGQDVNISSGGEGPCSTTNCPGTISTTKHMGSFDPISCPKFIT